MTRKANSPHSGCGFIVTAAAMIGTMLGSNLAAQGQVEADKFGRIPGWQRAIEASLDTWNRDYAFTVDAVGWTNLGLIVDEADRAATVAMIADPAAAWFPSVDVDDPPSATALQIPDDPTITPEQVDAWMGFVDSAVKVGHRKVEIEWFKTGHGSFTSLCIVDPRGIVYDTMISNIAGGGPDPDRGRQCLDYRMWWAWQAGKPHSEWTRGHIRAHNNPVCRNGQVIACDYDCNDVSMSLGDAKLNCSSKQINNQCCQLTYSWAWHTSGFKSIKVGADGFTLEIEGSIGSSSSGGGSCTVCCGDRGEGDACRADFNADGLVDTRDVLAFLNPWSALDPEADFDGDGLVDSRDLLAFLAEWSVACG